MHLTLQQLRLFESVARNGSFTRAAEEMFLTQPAVSIQVKRLEEQVGLPIFEQVGKKIFMTAAGKELFAASQDILSRVSDLKRELEEIKGVVRGPLQLALVTTTEYFMTHLIGAFLQRYPDVEPRLEFTNRATLIQRLMNNEDDFVVMGQIPESDDLETYPFLENILVIAAPPNHPLVGRKNIPLEQLTNERLLSREPGSGTRLVFERELAKHDLAIEPYMELGSSEAIKQGVMAGLGIALLSLHSLKLEIDAGALVLLDVEDFPLRRRWYAVHLKGKRLSLVARTFLDFILEHSEEVLRNNAILPAKD